MNKIPFFMILGAPKCGTTALAHHLSQHPDIMLSKPKEPHFFDANYTKGIDFYKKEYFLNCKNKLLGEATPSYLAVPFVAERIFREFPKSKLIVLLRNPVERAYSSWWMLHVRGMEKLGFDKAIEMDLLSMEAGHLLEKEDAEDRWQQHVENMRMGAPLSLRTYLYSGQYSKHLMRYFEIFGHENVEIIFSSELRNDTENTLKRVCAHIGVSEDFPINNSLIANEAIGTNAKEFLALTNKLGLMPMRHMMPESLKKMIKRQLSRMGKQPPMSKELSIYLYDYFEPYNRELETLLDIELDKGWYR